MTLAPTLRRSLTDRFGPLGEVEPVAGGSISAAHRVETREGPIFVKLVGPGAPPGLLEAEAAGLEELRGRTGEVRVPRVLALDGEEGPAAARWLALEWLEGGPAGAGFEESLARGLAALHGDRAETWGWHGPGFIGSLPQDNRAAASWPEFWATRRLEPQLRLARAAGARPGGSAQWERLLALLPELLAAGEEEGPSRLHGDLWSGNAVPLAGGGAALVDPSFHHGHREVDLAMMELFGGFGGAFRDAYAELLPLRPGYREVRRGTYQLYYLLVHVNLFGGGYAARTAEVLEQTLAAV